MLKQNIDKFKESNIDVWLEDNNGEGANVLILDEGFFSYPHMKNQVTILDFDYEYRGDEKKGSHGGGVMSVGNEVAPKAHIYHMPFNSPRTNRDKMISWLEENHEMIDIISMSTVFHTNSANKYFERIEKLNIPFIVASGNDGDRDKDGVCYPANAPYTIAVGMYALGGVQRDSNGGEMLNVVAPLIRAPKVDGSITSRIGTSFATPFVTFSLALYISWRKRNGLPKLTQKECAEFVNTNAKDLTSDYKWTKLKEGFDYESGWGLFSLPSEIPKVEKVEIPKTPEEKSIPEAEYYYFRVGSSWDNLHTVGFNNKEDAIKYAKNISGYNVYDATGFLVYEGIKAPKGTPIISNPTATVEQMKHWAFNKNASQLFIDLADVFYQLSVRVGVNPVMVYAQSAKETAYMKFGGVLDASYNNPCGMKNTSGGGNYDKDAHMRFDSWIDGISAQLDHLALYAGMEGYPKLDTLDPRHFSYLLGTAKTVENLGGKWAPSETYGEDIVRMMDAIKDIEVEIEVIDMDGFLNVKDINGIPFVIDQVPRNTIEYKATFPMQPKYLVIHNTGNTSPGATDTANNNYMKNDDYVLWHFTVDEDSITQGHSFYRSAFHAGDGAKGKGNATGIGIEIAENGDVEKAVYNAFCLMKVLEDLFPGIDIKPHQFFSGKYCPRWILDNWGWDGFIGRYNKFKTPINKLKLSVNGKVKYITGHIENGVSYADIDGMSIPLRLLGEGIGFKVGWDANNKIIIWND